MKAYQSLEIKLPEIIWEKEEAKTLSHMLFGDVPFSDVKVTQIEDWEQLQTLLSTLQSLDVYFPIWSSKGACSEPSNGFIVGFSSEASLPPIQIDKHSFLLRCDSRYTLEEVESYAQINGYSIGFRPFAIGTVREWVENGETSFTQISSGIPAQLVYEMTVVLPSGALVRLGGVPRSATGPDLKHLFWGSAGTLGFVKNVHFRLKKLPTHSSYWKIGQMTWEKMVEFLCSMVRERIHVEDSYASFSLAHSTGELCLHLGEESSAFLEKRIGECPHAKEISSLPIPLFPEGEAWLVCQGWWSRILQLPQYIEEFQPVIQNMDLLHFQHDSATVFLSLNSSLGKEKKKKYLFRLLKVLQKHGFVVQGDHRILPWKELDSLHCSLIQKIKADIDPKKMLNPHLLDGKEES